MSLQVGASYNIIYDLYHMYMMYFERFPHHGGSFMNRKNTHKIKPYSHIMIITLFQCNIMGI